MLAKRRPPVAAMPLCDLSMPKSLLARRRLGRASYLIALIATRRVKGAAVPAQFVQGRVGSAAPNAARTR